MRSAQSRYDDLLSNEGKICRIPSLFEMINMVTVRTKRCMRMARDLNN